MQTPKATGDGIDSFANIKLLSGTSGYAIFTVALNLFIFPGERSGRLFTDVLSENSFRYTEMQPVGSFCLQNVRVVKAMVRL